MSSYQGVAKPSPPILLGKKELVDSLLKVKDQSGKTYDEIAEEVGLTNAFTAALFYNQAQLQAEAAEKLKKAVPGLTEEQLSAMKRAPFRNYPTDIIQEPLVYRINEAILHYGHPIKALINEKLGDGIMSGIGFFLDVDTIKGVDGEDRVVITFNGKFLPYTEQKSANNTAKPAKQQ